MCEGRKLFGSTRLVVQCNGSVNVDGHRLRSADANVQFDASTDVDHDGAHEQQRSSGWMCAMRCCRDTVDTRLAADSPTDDTWSNESTGAVSRLAVDGMGVDAPRTLQCRVVHGGVSLRRSFGPSSRGARDQVGNMDTPAARMGSGKLSPRLRRMAAATAGRRPGEVVATTRTERDAASGGAGTVVERYGVTRVGDSPHALRWCAGANGV
jgi:hypothetical protein